MAKGSILFFIQWWWQGFCKQSLILWHFCLILTATLFPTNRFSYCMYYVWCLSVYVFACVFWSDTDKERMRKVKTVSELSSVSFLALTMWFATLITRISKFLLFIVRGVCWKKSEFQIETFKLFFGVCFFIYGFLFCCFSPFAVKCTLLLLWIIFYVCFCLFVICSICLFLFV